MGTVVMVYKTDAANSEYEIEFVDNDGHTLALLSLKEDDIEPVRQPLMSKGSYSGGEGT